jgi:hypothetical protein
MITLKAIRNHPYGGAVRRVGDVYQAPEKHAKLMVAIHNSVICESGEEPLPPVPVETRVQEVELSPRTGKPKRAYKRRDMRAEH